MTSSAAEAGKVRVSPIRRMALTLVAVLGCLSATSLGTSGAQFNATTSNSANFVEAIDVNNPTDAQGSLSLSLLTLNCRANLSWSASTTPGVTGYQIRRVTTSTGSAVTFTTTGTTYTDAISLSLIGLAWHWEIRAIHGDFLSDPATITPSNALLCIL